MLEGGAVIPRAWKIHVVNIFLWMTVFRMILTREFDPLKARGECQFKSKAEPPQGVVPS